MSENKECPVSEFEFYIQQFCIKDDPETASILLFVLAILSIFLCIFTFVKGKAKYSRIRRIRPYE